MNDEAITITKDPEEMMADLMGKFAWLFFGATTFGLVVLVEILILNRF